MQNALPHPATPEMSVVLWPLSCKQELQDQLLVFGILNLGVLQIVQLL
jgi:hypothetical protein